MIRRSTPLPEPPENRDDAGRPPAPPPAAAGRPNATEALPEQAEERRAAIEALGNLDADAKAADWMRPWVREGFASYEEWAKEQER